jgi:hypothetical protein
VRHRLGGAGEDLPLGVVRRLTLGDGGIDKRMMMMMMMIVIACTSPVSGTRLRTHVGDLLGRGLNRHTCLGLHTFCHFFRLFDTDSFQYEHPRKLK